METFGEDVWNFAFFITKKSDAADDISQEVFLTAFEQLYAFRGECSVKSWLLTITRNKSFNFLKKAFFRKVILMDTIRPQGDASPSAEKVMFDRMETAQLWSNVMKLPRKFREILILNYHYELTMKEMTELLQLSEGTVKSRLHRAKAHMSKMVSTDNEGGWRK
ncbi:sigma-70 family RNA polymerase sigma factor [Paenibacillus sp. WST5]|uniref:Sigma-70 family RNA polymerase sigma factor n=2 Tax=Paenibacillus sedimenti TaxID=2770274 RepID=A0A926KV27_9BACL|nr:sigma-70 family RNA polymerase sigma factor [Paenibacillus sedimenti]